MIQTNAYFHWPNLESDEDSHDGICPGLLQDGFLAMDLQFLMGPHQLVGKEHGNQKLKVAIYGVSKERSTPP